MSVVPSSLQWMMWCTSRPRVAPHNGLRHCLSRCNDDPSRAFGDDPLGTSDTRRDEPSSTKTGLIVPSQVQSRAMASGTAMPLIHVTAADWAGSMNRLMRNRSRRSAGAAIDERSATSTSASVHVTSCVALAEQSVASLGQCCVDERPMIGVEAAVQAPRPVPVLLQRQILTLPFAGAGAGLGRSGRDLEHDR